MKPIAINKRLSYFWLLIIFVIHGCCKSLCVDRTLFVNFRHIRSINADSVSFVQYVAGSGYTQKTDSVFINTPVVVTDTSYSPLFREINTRYDWKIINHSLNKVYRLNNFELEKIKCCSDRGWVVRSYEMNGIRETGDFFYVD